MNQKLIDIPVWGFIVYVFNIIGTDGAFSYIASTIYDSVFIVCWFAVVGSILGLGSSYGIIRLIQLIIKEDKRLLKLENEEK